MLELARDVVAIAREGLKRRDVRDSQGRDETRFLGPLEESLEAGRTPAEALLERYETDWNRSVEPIFDECAY